MVLQPPPRRMRTMKPLTTMMELQHSADCNPNVKGACSILGSVLISSHVLPYIWMKWIWCFFRYSMRWYEIVSHSFYLPTFPDPTKAATAFGCKEEYVRQDTFDLFLEVWDISRLTPCQYLLSKSITICYLQHPTTKETKGSLQAFQSTWIQTKRARFSNMTLSDMLW